MACFCYRSYNAQWHKTSWYELLISSAPISAAAFWDFFVLRGGFASIWSATENEQLAQAAREPAAVWDLKFNARPQEWPLESLFCANCHSQWVAKNGQLESNHAHLRSRQLFIHTKTLLKPMTATAARDALALDSAPSWKSMDGWILPGSCAKGRRGFDVCKCAREQVFFPQRTHARELLHNDAFENKLIFTLVISRRCGLSE